jgi:hypothetical protein
VKFHPKKAQIKLKKREKINLKKEQKMVKKDRLRNAK